MSDQNIALSLNQTTILEWFADNTFILAEMVGFVFYWIENL